MYAEINLYDQVNDLDAEQSCFGLSNQFRPATSKADHNVQSFPLSAKLEAVVPNTHDLLNQTYLNLQKSRKSLNTNYKKSSSRSNQEQQDVSEQNVYENIN